MWVDALYPTHHDMKIHTVVGISMGLELVHGKSSKKKINTNSSTETELVGTSDYIPWTIWPQRFLVGQGYNLKRNICIEIMKVQFRWRTIVGCRLVKNSGTSI